MKNQSIDFEWTVHNVLRLDQKAAIAHFERNYMDYKNFLFCGDSDGTCEDMAYNFFIDCLIAQGFGDDPEITIPVDIYKQSFEKIFAWCKQWWSEKKTKNV